MSQAVQELMLLLEWQQSDALLSWLQECYQNASRRLTPETKVEYFLTLVLGKIHIPSGGKNYYHNLIDSLSFSEEEWNTVEEMYKYLQEKVQKNTAFYEDIYSIDITKTPAKKYPKYMVDLAKSDRRYVIGKLRKYGAWYDAVRFQIREKDILELLEDRGVQNHFSENEFSQVIKRELLQISYQLLKNQSFGHQTSVWYEKAKSFRVQVASNLSSSEYEQQELLLSGTLEKPEIAKYGKQLKLFIMATLMNMLYERLELTWLDY